MIDPSGDTPTRKRAYVKPHGREHRGHSARHQQDAACEVTCTPAVTQVSAGVTQVRLTRVGVGRRFFGLPVGALPVGLRAAAVASGGNAAPGWGRAVRLRDPAQGGKRNHLEQHAV